MPSRNRPHEWTAFDQHALLCLLCRQIQLTGTTSPTRIRKGGRNKTVFSLSGSIKHAHRDVADLLNRSLNYGNHANDIPAEDVSAMIDQLMEERKDAVGYLERQGVGRITRTMKRVWERGCRVEVVGGGRKDVWEGFDSMKTPVRNAGGRKSRGKVRVAAHPERNGSTVNESNGQVVDSAMDAQDVDDPWGDKVTTPSALAQTDPWGDEVITPFANAQGAADAWSPDNVDVAMADAQDATDPWRSNESTFVNTTSSDDPWASWTSTDSPAVNTNTSDDPWASWVMTDSAAVNTNNSNDPCTDTSSAFVSTAKSDFVSSEAQSMASVTTSPSSPTEQSFTGINSERLAMLDAGAEFGDEIVQEWTHASKGKGENAVKLPFNRLAMNSNKKAEFEAQDINEESEISEEE